VCQPNSEIYFYAPHISSNFDSLELHPTASIPEDVPSVGPLGGGGGAGPGQEVGGLEYEGKLQGARDWR